MPCSCGRPLSGRQTAHCSIACRRRVERDRRHERAARAVDAQWREWQSRGWAPIDVSFADATVDQLLHAGGLAAAAWFREAEPWQPESGDPIDLPPWKP